MNDNNGLNREVEEYIDQLTVEMQKNKEAVEIFNLVDTAHKNLFPKSYFGNKLIWGIGAFFVFSFLFIFLYYKSPNPSVLKNAANQSTDLKEIASISDDSLMDSNLKSQDTSNLNQAKDKETKTDSIFRPNVNIEIDSIIGTYTIKVEKSRYKIFDVSSKLLELIKSYDIDILVSDISRDKGKIITRNKTDYSNTFGKIIFYNIEYYISSDDLEYIVKMNLINKSSNINYSDSKKDNIPNPLEKKFYNLMKEHISSFYGD